MQFVTAIAIPNYHDPIFPNTSSTIPSYVSSSDSLETYKNNTWAILVIKAKNTIINIPETYPTDYNIDGKLNTPNPNDIQHII